MESIETEQGIPIEEQTVELTSLDPELNPQNIDAGLDKAREGAADLSSDKPSAAETTQETVSKELSLEDLGAGLSVLSRTGTGLSHAFIKLEIHSKELTSVDILTQVPHLRYVVRRELN